MKLFKNLKHGFTLLEVIIALGIFTIVMSVVFPFFLSNYKTINKTSIKSDLQWEAENIMQYVSKSFMEGSSIENINYTIDDNVNYVKIKLDNNNYYSFKIKEDKLIYERNENKKNVEKVVGQNISKFKIIPFPKEDGDFSHARGVDIEIVVEKKGIKYSVKDHIFLRNSN